MPSEQSDTKKQKLVVTNMEKNDESEDMRIWFDRNKEVDVLCNKFQLSKEVAWNLIMMNDVINALYTLTETVEDVFTDEKE